MHFGCQLQNCICEDLKNAPDDETCRKVLQRISCALCWCRLVQSVHRNLLNARNIINQAFSPVLCIFPDMRYFQMNHKFQFQHDCTSGVMFGRPKCQNAVTEYQSLHLARTCRQQIITVPGLCCSQMLRYAGSQFVDLETSLSPPGTLTIVEVP